MLRIYAGRVSNAASRARSYNSGPAWKVGCYLKFKQDFEMDDKTVLSIVKMLAKVVLALLAGFLAANHSR